MKRGVKPLFPLILTPEEWNTVVDALNELDGRAPLGIKGGLAVFDGDGATTQFTIPHGLGATPTTVLVGKGASGLPDIDYYEADADNITVTFKAPPSSGSQNVKIWWLAVKL